MACPNLEPILFRGKRNQVSFDERDQLINYRAVLGAYSVFWLVFTAACTIPWSIIGPSGSISVNVMPTVIVEGIAVFIFIQSLTTLIQYGWKGKDGKR